MPPSLLLSTRYKTARRRYPVICRGPTTFCHDFVLLHGRCGGASASAGATVKWCQFNDDQRLRGGCYAACHVIRVRRCGTTKVLSIDRRAKTTISFTIAWRRMKNPASRFGAALYHGRTGVRVTTNSCTAFSSSSRISNYLEHRGFSIPVTGRKQQNVVTWPGGPA